MLSRGNDDVLVRSVFEIVSFDFLFVSLDLVGSLHSAEDALQVPFDNGSELDDEDGVYRINKEDIVLGGTQDPSAISGDIDASDGIAESRKLSLGPDTKAIKKANITLIASDCDVALLRSCKGREIILRGVLLHVRIDKLVARQARVNAVESVVRDTQESLLRRHLSKLVLRGKRDNRNIVVNMPFVDYLSVFEIHAIEFNLKPVLPFANFRDLSNNGVVYKSEVARLRVEYMKLCCDSSINLQGLGWVLSIWSGQNRRLDLLLRNHDRLPLGSGIGRVLGQHFVDRLDGSSEGRTMEGACGWDRVLFFKFELFITAEILPSQNFITTLSDLETEG
ncbi:hypothetical protein HG530_009019 [Fusarium avenaceum]|nr:hypothetical protein HG530_009019 [Fusarium avenaceum]